MVAKKSAPSQYNPPPLLTASRDRSVSPMSLDDQLLYIEKWGVNQFKPCDECINSNLNKRCFVAPKVSRRCGNCLVSGKQCHFSRPGMVDSDEDEELRAIVQEDDVVIGQRQVSRVHQRPPCAE